MLVPPFVSGAFVFDEVVAVLGVVDVAEGACAGCFALVLGFARCVDVLE